MEVQLTLMQVLLHLTLKVHLVQIMHAQQLLHVALFLRNELVMLIRELMHGVLHVNQGFRCVIFQVPGSIHGI